ncbi:hypothetical protein BC828DRAFT_405753 [Blastocladiella britannica]|nr:hypothetical protein BC828DRAFT_405753 [Blastocladiella britannica]
MQFRCLVGLLQLLAAAAWIGNAVAGPSARSPIRVFYCDDVSSFQVRADDWSTASGIPVHIAAINASIKISSTELGDMLQIMMLQRRAYFDIVFVDVIWPSVFTDLLLPLETAMNPRVIQSFDQGMVQAAVVNNSLLAVPFKLPFATLYYRYDLLQKYNIAAPPATWDEMETQLATILAGERSAGTEMAGFLGQFNAYEGLTCNVMEIFASAGAGPVVEGDSQDPNIPTLSTLDPAKRRAAVGILSRFRRWLTTGLMPPTLVGLVGMEDPTSALFKSGRAVFMRNWFNPKTMIVDTPGAIGAVALIPGETVAQRGFSTNGGNYLGINRFSSSPTDAVRVLEFLSTSDNQLWWYQEEGWSPTLTSLRSDPAFCARMDSCNVSDTRVFSRPAVLTGNQYMAVSEKIYTNVHEALAGSMSVDDALTKMTNSIASILHINVLGPVLLVAWESSSGVVATTVVAINMVILIASAVPMARSALKCGSRRLWQLFITASLWSGGLCIALWPLTFLGPASTPTCSLRILLWLASFTVILASVVIRDLQAYFIVTSSGARVSRSVVAIAWSFMLGVFSLQAAAMLLWYIASPPRSVVVPVHDTWHYSACDLGQRRYLLAPSLLINAGLIALNLWLAVQASLNRAIQRLQRIPTLRMLYTMLVLAATAITVGGIEVVLPSIRVLTYSLCSLVYTAQICIVGLRSQRPVARSTVQAVESSMVGGNGGGTEMGLCSYQPSGIFSTSSKDANLRWTNLVLGTSKSVGVSKKSLSREPGKDSSVWPLVTFKRASAAMVLEVQLGRACRALLVPEQGMIVVTEAPGEPRFRTALSLKELVRVRSKLPDAQSSSSVASTARSVRLEFGSGHSVVELSAEARSSEWIDHWVEYLVHLTDRRQQRK